jgi:hypothetical protein
MNTAAPVIALDHPAALDAARVGRIAADLAAARAAALPAAPGVVLTTDWVAADDATARQVWQIVSHDGERPLMVRASAPRRAGTTSAPTAIEQPTVVHDVTALLGALAGLRDTDASMPVLLQPVVDASWRGALFADEHPLPRTRPVVVARPARGDDRDEWTAELDHAGRVRVELSGGPPAPPPAVLARVAWLAAKVAAHFGGPHDLDWLADPTGRVQLLRLRPVLRVVTGDLPGLVPGPGEVVTAA